MKDETLIWLLVIGVILWYVSKQDNLPATTQPVNNTGSVRDNTAAIVHDASDLVQSIIDLFKQGSSQSSLTAGSAQER